MMQVLSFELTAYSYVYIAVTVSRNFKAADTRVASLFEFEMQSHCFNYLLSCVCYSSGQLSVQTLLNLVSTI